MDKKQWIVVGLLAVANVFVLSLACVLIVIPSLGSGPGVAVPVAGVEPTATLIPTQTPIPTWTPRPTFTPQSQPTLVARAVTGDNVQVLDQVEREVRVLRGLEPLDDVPCLQVTADQLQYSYLDLFIRDEWREAADVYVLYLSALDFMPASTDLLGLWRENFAQGVAGFYVPDSDEIYLVTNAYDVGSWERSIYAHEFTHALQDQHFDLQALGLDVTGEPGHADTILSLQGLIEGDATLLQEQYIETYFTEADALDALNTYLSFDFDYFGGSYIPEVLGELAMFPYEDGLEFVSYLYDQGSWAAVDAAYANPPASTEHILHPERYLAGDQPRVVSIPVLGDTLGPGWRVPYEETMGEFLLRVYLANRLETGTSISAAAGWGGDQAVLYYNDASGETLLVVRWVWDTPDDQGEFQQAYVRYAEERFAGAGEPTGVDTTCWSGMDTLCVIWGAEQSTLVIGSNGEDVARVLPSLAD